MTRKKYIKLISTDSVGWLGSPRQFVELYKDYFQDGTFNGVEMIAFKPESKLKHFIDRLKTNKIKTISFHGKTGGENRLPAKYGIVMTLVNAFIFGPEKLTATFKDVEILFHTPYLQDKKVKQSITNNKPKALWIENHDYGKKGVEEAIKQIQDYRKNEVNAYGMLDLFHLLAKTPTSELVNDWSKIVSHIESYLKWFSGIHFPIGSRKDDSLPIEVMTDNMLFLFGKKIVPKLKRIVIENQQRGLGMFFPTRNMLDKQRKRNETNFNRLKKAKIL